MPLANANERIRQHLQVVYPELDEAALGDAIIDIMRFREQCHTPLSHHNNWSQATTIVITYGNSITRTDEKPLQTLHHFLNENLKNTISSVHVLPFYPYSSDDGFAVIEYTSVNESLGDWSHINSLAEDYQLMADLVINHCSSRSRWFENYKNGVDPGASYFIEMNGDEDLSDVVRPRATPLLNTVRTADGEKHVWCTFGPDQIDLNFKNPEVLLEFVRIIRLYLDQGISIFRLDAVAFLWKRPGSNCINLRETHEIVRLIRTLIEHANPDAILITETNIPSRENLEYFGNSNEAHMIYNFSLPPLLVNTLLTGSCHQLKLWMMGLPPAQSGTTYFNFIASHDGIGLRPAEGLLSDEEIELVANTIQSFGGRVSYRATAEGKAKPYELNVSLIDALKGTVAGEDEYQIDRFICAHQIMLALEGVPAFYIHSLLATPNDYEKLEHTSHNRSINRHVWDETQLDELLADPASTHHIVLNRLKALIEIRSAQPAFHPNATQYTLQLGDKVFAFWRQSIDRRQSVFSLSNVSNEPQTISLLAINLIEMDQWYDLISGEPITDLNGELQLAPYQSVWLANVRK